MLEDTLRDMAQEWEQDRLMEAEQTGEGGAEWRTP